MEGLCFLIEHILELIRFHHSTCTAWKGNIVVLKLPVQGSIQRFHHFPTTEIWMCMYILPIGEMRDLADTDTAVNRILVNVS